MEPKRLSELNVVGYADVLTDRMVPRTVAPLFADQNNPDVIITPPFSIGATHVVNGTECTRDELDNMEIKEQVTLFPDPFAARSGNLLWVDTSMQAHYEAASLVRQHLKETAQETTAQAIAALSACQLDEADSLANRSISAHEAYFEAWVVKAAVQRLRGREELVEVFRETAAVHCRPETFNQILDALVRRVDTKHLEIEPEADGPGDDCFMAGMAGIHVRALDLAQLFGTAA